MNAPKSVEKLAEDNINDALSLPHGAVKVTYASIPLPVDEIVARLEGQAQAQIVIGNNRLFLIGWDKSGAAAVIELKQL